MLTNGLAHHLESLKLKFEHMKSSWMVTHIFGAWENKEEHKNLVRKTPQRQTTSYTP